MESWTGTEKEQKSKQGKESRLTWEKDRSGNHLGGLAAAVQKMQSDVTGWIAGCWLIPLGTLSPPRRLASRRSNALFSLGCDRAETKRRSKRALTEYTSKRIRRLLTFFRGIKEAYCEARDLNSMVSTRVFERIRPWSMRCRPAHTRDDLRRPNPDFRSSTIRKRTIFREGLFSSKL